jgi:hypothetical protein
VLPHDETKRGHARESRPASASIAARSSISGVVRKRTPIQGPDASTATAGLCHLRPQMQQNSLVDHLAGAGEKRRIPHGQLRSDRHTWRMSMPVIILNSSPATWESEPIPEDAMLSLPGLALALATSSGTVRAGSDGCTTRMNRVPPSLATGAMSRMKSR